MMQLVKVLDTEKNTEHFVTYDAAITATVRNETRIREYTENGDPLDNFLMTNVLKVISGILTP